MRVMLLSDIPPCSNYTAGLVVAQLCDFLLKRDVQIDCFCVKDQYVNPDYSKYKDRIDFHFIKKPSENLGINRPSFSIIGNKYIRKFKLNKIKKEFINFCGCRKYDVVWAPVQGQTMICLVKDCADSINTPYITEIWDPPQWWLNENKFDNTSKKVIMNKFSELIHNSSYCMCASEEMAEYYSKKYSTKCIPVIPSLSEKTIRKKKRKDKAFSIGFSGQMYAIEEWKAFTCALDSINWKINNKTIEVHFYGQYINFDVKDNWNFINHGWVEQDKCLEELSKCDMVYCPYWFNKDFDIVSRLSFPSKLTSYLMVKVPVFIHAPQYASISKFCKKNNTGYICNTLNESGIIETIKKVYKKDKNNINNGYNAFVKYLSLPVMEKSFIKCINESIKKSQHIQVVELNNTDLAGRRFNGYDLIDDARDDFLDISQIVIDKKSTNNRVKKLLNKRRYKSKYRNKLEIEQDTSVQNRLVSNYVFLSKIDEYKKSDIVHLHLFHNGLLGFEDLLKVSNEKKLIWTVHDLWVVTGHCIQPGECNLYKTGCKECEHLEWPLAIKEDFSAYNRWLKFEYFNKLKIDVVVSTKWMFNKLKEVNAYPNSKIHIIPFGINIDKFNKNKKECRRKFNIDDDSFVIGFRSDISPYKGLEFILKALDVLTAKYKNIVVMNVGQKGLCKNIENKSRVIELGWVNDDDLMSDYYNALNLFIMPSTAESFGFMAVESMAAKCPVIVSKNTVLEEVTFSSITNNAVKYGDVQSLCNKIIEYIEDKDNYIKMQNEFYKIAKNKYSLQRYIKDIKKLYKEVYYER